ncbi:nucleotide exchange factor GrpE [Halodesulfovibrio marinisediminis]|uniref:Protein GrpE n=1 Tax=Halodesulfovibrio marinisediminis DSM 17456 TaxID=1121457 RepID=A0A1N6IT92_9BACT|nr:nucleotide exchange factor GrpE [Halodesulfovibrio marinisediminis]SIO35236.1 molecular chaperone GrpE [Halodesulfovibrio marinisediminis DSM 17456]
MGEDTVKPEEAVENTEQEQTTEIVISDEQLNQLAKDRVCPGCDTMQDAEEVRLRCLAEMENFKKRLQREREEQFKYATESVLGDLLPTLDNLQLAIDYGRNLEGCENMLVGVEMTQKLFLEAIERHGLTPLGEKNDEFNPEIHEAVGQENCDDVPEGHVKHVMQRGYKLKDRMLRPAKVIVSGGK